MAVGLDRIQSHMNTLKRVAIALLCGCCTYGADSPSPKIFIEPQGGFEVYISAALFKKHVPVVVAKDASEATYTLKSGQIATQEERSGLGKLARCAYALCMGIDGSQTVSVELSDSAGRVAWAYSVRKMGIANYQSSAEAIAKHLKGFLQTEAKKEKRHQ